MICYDMPALGIVMILICLFVFFVPYRRMNRAIAAVDFPAALTGVAK